MFFKTLGIAFFLCSAVAADDTVTIPLKDIWALEMPGTKDVNELDPKQLLIPMVIGQLRRIPVDQLPPYKPADAGEAFAVVGSGTNALKAAYRVFVDKKKPPQSFASNDAISIVFFAYQFGAYVHVDHVERNGTTIEIFYRFVPHLTAEVTQHFAIIPVGHLSAGDYDVKITQLPMMGGYVPPKAIPIDQDAEQKYVCKPFSFSVIQK